MTKTFTPNDVLRYLYKETNKVEKSQLEEAMLVHADLLDQYLQLTSIKEQLDQVRIAPREETIQAILEYSRTQHPYFILKLHRTFAGLQIKPAISLIDGRAFR